MVRCELLDHGAVEQVDGVPRQRLPRGVSTDDSFTRTIKCGNEQVEVEVSWFGNLVLNALINVGLYLREGTPALYRSTIRDRLHGLLAQLQGGAR